MLNEYGNNPDSFSIRYRRKKATRKISENVQRNIINELATDFRGAGHCCIEINYINNTLKFRIRSSDGTDSIG